MKTREITQNDLNKLLAHTKKRIKEYTTKHEKFSLNQEIISQKLSIPKKFFEFRFICFGCGETVDKSTYAIAQNAMGNTLIYTCECGYKTKIK